MTERQDPQRSVPKDTLDQRLALQLGNFEEDMLNRRSLEDMIRSLNLYKSERQRMSMDDVGERMRQDLKIQQMEREILSRTTLEQIIQNPRLDLYRKQRTQTPLAAVVEKMRSRDVDIRMLNPPGAPGAGSAFRISFTYPDRNKAQAVVRVLLTEFTEQNVRERARAKESGDEKAREIIDHKVGLNLEVLDPASLPEKPAGPNRLLIAVAGLALGLLLGILMLRLGPTFGPFLRSVRSLNSGIRKIPQPPEAPRCLALGHGTTRPIPRRSLYAAP